VKQSVQVTTGVTTTGVTTGGGAGSVILPPVIVTLIFSGPRNSPESC